MRVERGYSDDDNYWDDNNDNLLFTQHSVERETAVTANKIKMNRSNSFKINIKKKKENKEI